MIGPQEPPNDYRIFNCRRADGSFPPLSEFFETAVQKADAHKSMTTKLAFICNEVPEEIVRHAQVMIVTGNTWHIFGSAGRAHGDREAFNIPEVSCTVIDISPIDELNSEKVAEIIGTCTDPNAGVINMAGLVTGLSALGGVVTERAHWIGSKEWFDAIPEQEF